MANRLFSTNPQRLGKFGRGFRIWSQEGHRSYSNQRKNTYVEQVLFGHTAERQGTPTVWPDPNLGCLGAKDKRFNLPGNVGLESAAIPGADREIASPEQLKANKKIVEDEIAFWRDLCDAPTSYQRQVNTLNHHEQVEKVKEAEMAAGELALQREKLDLECIPQSCPDLLRREMTTLFGSAHLASGPLTVITFCHRTKLDMSSWSPDVEDERDTMVDYFVNSAKELCQQLRSRAQWADFIDPSSGRPFYGKYTNLTFFETDERYRHLGFRVVDLGCCKVISHHKWGTHAFVGSIFTSAPHDSEYLGQILDNYNSTSDAKVKGV